VTTETQKKRSVQKWAYVLDFNERCPNVEYYLAFLRQLKDKIPTGFGRIEYVEQPTARDLKAHPENTMHEAAELCPVVIDESLIDVDSLLLAHKGTDSYDHDCVGRGKAENIRMWRRHELPRRSAHTDGELAGSCAEYLVGRGKRAAVLASGEQSVGASISGYVSIKDGMMQTEELNKPGLGALEG
jgi:hypothetical protein